MNNPQYKYFISYQVIDKSTGMISGYGDSTIYFYEKITEDNVEDSLALFRKHVIEGNYPEDRRENMSVHILNFFLLPKGKKQ